ncbi:mitochondrial import inner membrane translocase subunit [Cryptosporidium ubiquitum]|uniref:Mitochondrial import inner membrane translocase subunit n=1 Tax=Cryptosporidium ubiquitum TaxID=857276 RepID=A0A1J4MD29_9CRYT|nr:mitochondrial import inner membrane translocase subunit [Cryptosporidium ubiquitum]OII72144.1 mitochondrial import inner membrane translocase subunit [Cryptosporidium ubiquitum]
MGEPAEDKPHNLPNNLLLNDNLKLDKFDFEATRFKRKQDLYLNSYDRLWGEKVTYSVGLSYGTGFFLGSTYGLVNAMKKPALTPKLKINSILNECASNSAKVANPLSIITLFYCGFYRATKAIRKKDDSLNSLISGALSGALYKSASSTRVMGRYTLISAGKLGLKKKTFRQFVNLKKI